MISNENPKTVAKYTKKPITVEAMRICKGFDFDKLISWCDKIQVYQTPKPHFVPPMTIKTLEGDMEIVEGDWIIKGVEGEFYPCKDSIFRKTYEDAINGHRLSEAIPERESR